MTFMLPCHRDFAEQIYDFLLRNAHSGYFAGYSADESIAEIESHLSDLAMVKETIKDLEEITDELDDHEYYVTEAKPLLCGLREIQSALESEQRRRMVSDTKYEVKHAIHVGEKEILFAEDKSAEDGLCWFVGDYTENDLFGQYSECICSDDYLEALEEFTTRVTAQIETMRVEIKKDKTPCKLYTAEHCYPDDYSQDIGGKIVALKADILRPEYRRGEVQLLLVTGGSGAKAGARGTTVFCLQLYSGERSRFRRHDFWGEVKPEFVPPWAKETLSKLRGNPDMQHSSIKDREDR